MRLHVQNLSFSYQDRKILSGVDLSVAQGEIVGLLGPNGSGKSTLLKNVLGSLHPRSGRVVYHDFAPSSMGEPSSTSSTSPRDVSRRVAFVPQQTALRSTISVFDAVLLGRLPHLVNRWAGFGAKDRRHVIDTLKSVGLLSFQHRDVTTLSGGELQKVIIARCLVQESKLLLLDEATSGLDVNHAIEIMELMREKADNEGKCILTVLHDINLAAQFCDRLVLLKDGTVYRWGTPQEVLIESVLNDVYGIPVIVNHDERGIPVIVPRRRGKGHNCVGQRNNDGVMKQWKMSHV